MLKLFKFSVSQFLFSSFLFSSFSFCFADKIQNLIQDKTPEASVGILIEQVNTGKILYSYNAGHAYAPASNNKILTAIAALKQLGNSYEFLTVVSANNSDIQDHVLNSPIYIKFSGDPSLTSDDLQDLINTLKTLGIQKINGDVILDTSEYSGSPVPLGVVHDDLPYCFMAPIQSVILNQNCINFSVNLNSNNQMVIDKQANAEGFSIINNLVQIPGKDDPKTCTFYPHMDQNNQVILEGCLTAKQNINFSFAIANPTLYAEKIIQQTLLANNIQITGSIKTGLQSKDTKILASHHSDPLINLVTLMLTTSNNIYAGSLTHAVGYAYYGVGSNKAGVNAIESIDSALMGKPFTYFEIEDGAGDSRYNMITPNDLVDLLQAAYKDPTLRNDLLISLPRSGMTGTLKYRMGHVPLLGNVYAKTGSMQGISTLSGYLKTRQGKIYVFSIMINGLASSLHPARDLQDAILAIFS